MLPAWAEGGAALLSRSLSHLGHGEAWLLAQEARGKLHRCCSLAAPFIFAAVNSILIVTYVPLNLTIGASRSKSSHQLPLEPL